ncbi:Uncharacterised protein [Mycobacteroides abscessus subsp. abscessus]|nr:Uncharacterised protein [Mycobacteroides abscessus subsp. abscessus]
MGQIEFPVQPVNVLRVPMPRFEHLQGNLKSVVDAVCEIHLRRPATAREGTDDITVELFTRYRHVPRVSRIARPGGVVRSSTTLWGTPLSPDPVPRRRVPGPGEAVWCPAAEFSAVAAAGYAHSAATRTSGRGWSRWPAS